ncbi:hypothetical protein [Sphingopyxis sp. KK2]|uniref:hypothetical protein n=1 Tax=Sphingopyxis sp. KK2 TaxID=1855727 RepID=UPI00097E5A70|nr:hypothetical protein [Sphingopyxis sp. KK2]
MMSLMIVALMTEEPKIVERTVIGAAPVGSIEFPDEIAPAIIPYLKCTQAEFNKAQLTIETRKGDKGLGLDEMKEANDLSLAACAQQRVKAGVSARGLANRIPDKSSAERDAVVAAALAAVDSRLDGLMTMISQPLKALPPPTVPEGMTAGFLEEGAIMVPIAIDAQHGRYASCLSNESFDATRRMPKDRAVYRRQVETAIAKCAETRTAEEAAARTILRRSPEYPDAAAADAAVKASFDASEKMQRQLPEIMDATREKMRAGN